MEKLIESYYRKINQINYEKKRYLFDEIANSNLRLYGIIGERGVGKTTLMLQIIKEKEIINSSIYFSADNNYFNTRKLYDVIEELHSTGIVNFFIDEIHKYENFSQELKNIYDDFKSINICFSGSSSIQISELNYDLSRRCKIFNMNGFSFREYLLFTKNLELPTITVDEILNDKSALNRYRGYNLSLLLKEYFNYGYYPYYLEDNVYFFEKLEQSINTVIEVDISYTNSFKTENISLIRRIINMMSTMKPGEINSTKIGSFLGRDNKTIERFINMLEKSGLINVIETASKGNAKLKKSKKIYFSNPTLYKLFTDINGVENLLGYSRECFFVNQLKAAGYKIHYSKIGDFEIKNNIFEIGGKNKNRKQIYNEKNAYIIKDNTDIGNINSRPLYIFGFLY